MMNHLWIGCPGNVAMATRPAWKAQRASCLWTIEYPSLFADLLFFFRRLLSMRRKKAGDIQQPGSQLKVFHLHAYCGERFCSWFPLLRLLVYWNSQCNGSRDHAFFMGRHSTTLTETPPTKTMFSLKNAGQGAFHVNPTPKTRQGHLKNIYAKLPRSMKPKIQAHVGNM